MQECKCRKYDTKVLFFEFTRWRIEATGLHCMKILAAGSMKPEKLKGHI
jgi:hypothetical protein